MKPSQLKRKTCRAYTLLEIIIVIIIVGILAALALPRYFSTVEYVRSAEALAAIKIIRGSMERCYLATADYTECKMNSPGPDPNNLDIEDPGISPQAHFTYVVNSVGGGAFFYRITATRNTLDGGNAGDLIRFEFRTDGTITRTGTGAFSAIK